MFAINKKDKLKGFISPMQDIVFKTLWSKGDDSTMEYLNRIISYVVGFDVKDFSIISNELPIESSKSIANKVDILLESKDKLHKINIELNPINKKITANKNISYLFKIAGEFYSGSKEERYLNDIHVEQVNLNGFYHEIKDIAIADYKLYDIKNKLENKSIKIHDVYLPRMKELCYDNNEIYLDFAMFMSQSFEEMEKYIKGNKERKSVMENLKNFVINENLPTYNYEEYIEALHKEVERDARAEGLAKGRAEGLAQGKAEGLEQGIEQGIERGIEQGRNQGIEEIKNKMRNKGLSEEEINNLLN